MSSILTSENVIILAAIGLFIFIILGFGLSSGK